MMNKRRALLGLLLFAVVSSLAMVFMSTKDTPRVMTPQGGSQATSELLLLSISNNSADPISNRGNSNDNNGNDSPLVRKLSIAHIASAVKAAPNSYTITINGTTYVVTTIIAKTTNTTAALIKTKLATVNKEPNPKPTAAPTNRPLLCKDCFKSDFPYITTVPEVCSGSEPPEMLMLITTTLDGLDRRQAIRDTWASVTKGNTANIRHIFLLGTDREGKVGPEIVQEAAKYKDMLVSGFVDAYSNLTLKTMAALHYFVAHCPKASFFFKTDQDMYNFPERILGLARQNANTLQTSLGGQCYQSGKPWRDPKTKYYASIRSYPQDTYPGFCSGTGYISSQNVARKILEASPNIPFFHLEDVYLSLVMRHLGYRLTQYPGFAEGSGVCRMREKARRALTIHEINAEWIRKFWSEKCGV